MQLKENIIPFLWISVGLLLNYIGINAYWNYSQLGILWLFIIPTYCEISNVIIGICCVILGLNLLKKNAISIGLTLLISILIPAMTIGIILYEYFKYGQPNFWAFTLFNFLIYILLVMTYKFMKTNGIIDAGLDIWNYFLRKKIILIVGCLALVHLSFLLSKALPYELFSH